MFCMVAHTEALWRGELCGLVLQWALKEMACQLLEFEPTTVQLRMVTSELTPRKGRGVLILTVGGRTVCHLVGITVVQDPCMLQASYESHRTCKSIVLQPWIFYLNLFSSSPIDVVIEDARVAIFLRDEVSECVRTDGHGAETVKQQQVRGEGQDANSSPSTPTPRRTPSSHLRPGKHYPTQAESR
ncbi:hypothetical protein AAFF_G00261050 [Aldrovandia affinis]|uniref:Uncharacterized protein n=1 Tax=Aldrovandia affinis TaxID=143900 RepID=A0AAD7W2T2_9TELE|nr:hypothetical protein AAFF_G00261050 [Aldrovandia affinis]